MNELGREARERIARIRARQRRWMAPGKSTVIHPRYGKVVVPHSSNLAAFDNAAEFWHVPREERMAFLHEARCVEWRPGDGPVRRPKEFCGGKT
jgi:hypothetical protein